MTEEQPLNVFQRINLAGQILQENQWIKDMQTSAYKSVDIDQIRRHVGAAEVQAGLVAIYTEDSFERFELNGKTLARITATITYVNIDEPSDRVDFVRSAVAFDSGDKGYNKCESMIYKNLYKGLYHIGERNEDPDATSNDENEILETVRWDRDALAEMMAIVKAHAPAVAKAKEEDQEKRRKSARANARAQAAQDSFFSKPPTKEQKPKAEEPKTEPKAEPKVIDIKLARATIARALNESPGSIDRYIQAYGDHLTRWPDDRVIECYKDLTEGEL